MTNSNPIQSIAVLRADDFCVVSGANLGDPFAPAADLVLDDIYLLYPVAPTRRLSLCATGDGSFCISDESEIGTCGDTVVLDSLLNLMSADGNSIEVLVLVEVDTGGLISEVYLLPLAPMPRRTEYSLVGIDEKNARRKFAQTGCVSFTKGTHITLSTGQQVRIEELNIGDRVLTRDDGAQEIRWIGHSTVRASGPFAPILIEAGVLNNEHDLLVGPDHRLFVYQRVDEIGAGRPELLVKARHLINGQTVTVQDGGFVDYYQILFDQHHIIYAEGIAAESMLIDPHTRPALPSELLQKIGAVLPRHGRRDAHGLDVQEALLSRPDAIDLLRRASAR